jgi:hypothetical protein
VAADLPATRARVTAGTRRAIETTTAARLRTGKGTLAPTETADGGAAAG